MGRVGRSYRIGAGWSNYGQETWPNPALNPIVLLAYRGSTLAVPVLIVISVLLASRQTGDATGMWMGIWMINQH